MQMTLAIEQLRGVLRRQHKARATETSYLSWLRRYVAAVQAMPIHWSSEQKLEQFLTHLARKRDLSASSQNQAFNAILFFYKEVLRQPLQNIEALRAKRPTQTRINRSVTKLRGSAEQKPTMKSSTMRGAKALASQFAERRC